MKIVRYYALGGPEVLQIEEVEVPKPEADQVLLRVEAVDVGYIDTQVRSSTTWGTPSFPVAPGGYVYGRVAQVGQDIANLREGDEVLAFAPSGAYAEYALVPAALCLPTFSGARLSPAEQVTIPIAGETAYHILTTAARLRPGERVLIHAAAGGVGHFAVQLARAMQAGQIIATASSSTKLDVAHTLGADTLINYTEPDWGERVRQATGGEGVDVILDMVGGQTSIESLPLLAHFGRLILYGAASGNIPSFSGESIGSLMMNLQRIAGFSMVPLMQQYPDLIEKGRQALRQYVEQGKVRPHIMHTFPLEEVAEAHRLLESRVSYGKIVLCP